MLGGSGWETNKATASLSLCFLLIVPSLFDLPWIIPAFNFKEMEHHTIELYLCLLLLFTITVVV